ARRGAGVPSRRSQPGSAWAISITAADPRALASANVSCSQAMLAALRAANSLASGLVSHRLLHEPWTLSVAKVTPPKFQRRFSTHGGGPFTPTPSRADCCPPPRLCRPFHQRLPTKTPPPPSPPPRP